MKTIETAETGRRRKRCEKRLSERLQEIRLALLAELAQTAPQVPMPEYESRT